MKSHYNIYHKGSNGKYYIYNTLSRALLGFDSQSAFEECCDSIRTGTSTENTSSKMLSNKGFIVHSVAEEKARLRSRQNAAVFSQRNLATTLITTLECNFRCPYCFESHRDVSIGPESIKSLEEFYKRYTVNIDALSVSWYGGEPLLVFDEMQELNSRVRRIVEYRSIEYNSAISTNGYLLDSDKAITLLRDFQISRINITLDGPSASHNKTRPHVSGKETFNRIRNNIIELCEVASRLRRKIFLRVRVNVSMDNSSIIMDLFDEFPESTRKYIRFVFVRVQDLSNIETDFKGGYLESAEQFFQERLKWVVIAKDKGYSRMSEKPGYSPRYGLFCGAERLSHFVIGPDCSLFKCATNVEDGDKVGSISSDGYVNYDLDKLIQWIDCASEKCARCKLLPVCNAGCKGQKYIGRDNCATEEWYILDQIERFASTGKTAPEAAFLFEDFET